MNKKYWFIFIGGFIFLVFIIFSYFVRQQVFTSFDIQMTTFLQGNISSVFNQPFSFLSLLGSLEVCTIFLVLLFIFLRRFVTGFITLLFFGAIHIFELYGKTFVIHPGPPARLLRYDLPFNFPTAYVRPGSSYPSGHAARALFITAILGMLALRSRRLTKYHKLLIFMGLACYDVLMCTSRIYLAEHWTSDVIGGALSGLSLALLAGIL